MKDYLAERLKRTCGAGPITIMRPDKNGKLVVVKKLPAPSPDDTKKGWQKFHNGIRK